VSYYAANIALERKVRSLRQATIPGPADYPPEDEREDLLVMFSNAHLKEVKVCELSCGHVLTVWYFEGFFQVGNGGMVPCVACGPARYAL